jgi:hypothetical protein
MPWQRRGGIFQKKNKLPEASGHQTTYVGRHALVVAFLSEKNGTDRPTDRVTDEKGAT